MRFLKRTFAGLTIALLAVVGISLLFPQSPPAQLPTKWTPQPDAFPLGTIVAGGTIEMSVGLRSDSKPPPLPAWISKLPRFLREVVESTIHKHRARAYRRAWRVQANVPDFLSLDRVEMDYHPFHGPFPTLMLRLTNAAPGSYSERILVELINRRSHTNTVVVPVNVTVLPGITQWKVLLTESPFEKYSTDTGKTFEPLAEITSRLSKRGVRADLLHELPKSLKDYDVVLVGETTLVQ